MTSKRTAERQELAIDIGLEILAARIDADLTQTTLAYKLGTKQPSVARAERGRVLATISFLARIGKITGHTLLIKLLRCDPRTNSCNTHKRGVVNDMIPKQAIVKAIEGGYKLPYSWVGNAVTFGQFRIALDPTFWQALGKALGWKDHSLEYESRIHAHDFYHLILTGGSTEEFWRDLLNQK